MSTSGEAAEQIVRLSLEGFEVAARLTGTAAKNVAILLMTVLKQEGKTTGKARLTNMIKTGKELKVFSIPQKDLKKFTEHAKKYGVLYTVLRDKFSRDPNTPIDIIARAEDASKIQRIVDKFEIGKLVDKATIVAEAQKDLAEKEAREHVCLEKTKGEQVVESVTGKPIQKDAQAPGNPTAAKTDKSPLSRPNCERASSGIPSANKQDEKPSVKEKLDRYKEEGQKKKGQQKEKGNRGRTEHGPKKHKKNKSKERNFK